MEKKNLNQHLLLLRRKGQRDTRHRRNVTVLLMANTSGMCKMKPLLYHKAKRPRAFKYDDMTKLPVNWHHNSKGWMTGSITMDWFDYSFIPDAKKLCDEVNIVFKVLLILDNVPDYPRFLVGCHPNVKVMFLPPNITSLIQPLDQEMIASFKSHYNRRLFNNMDKATDTDKEFLLEEEEEVATTPAASLSHLILHTL